VPNEHFLLVPEPPITLIEFIPTSGPPSI